MTDEEKKAIETLKDCLFNIFLYIKEEHGFTFLDDETKKKIEIVLNLIEKQENIIKEQADLLKQQHFIIECDEKTHDYDVKIIDEVKGRAVKYYKVIEAMAKELTNLIDEDVDTIIKRFEEEN